MEKKHFVLTIIGPRGSGKSHLLKRALQSGLEKQYDHTIVVSRSLDYNSDYDEFRGRDGYTLDSSPKASNLTKLIQQCEKAKKESEASRRRRRDDRIYCPDVLLILDDCIDTEAMSVYGGPMDTIATRGRHFDIAAIMTSQKLKKVSTPIRTNSDMMIFFSPFSLGDFEQFMDQFVWSEDRKAMRYTMKRLFATPHLFIILDNTESDPAKKIKVSDADRFVKGEADVLEMIQPPKKPRQKRKQPEPEVVVEYEQ